MSEDVFVVVETADLRLVFWPHCGGRLISASTGDTEVLWRNPDYLDAAGSLITPRSVWTPLDGTMGSWANVGGSKTWPAPQGWDGPDQWPGPPDPVLDSGSWEWSHVDAGKGGHTVTLTSPLDPWTGLRVERHFAIPATGTSFSQRNRFTNLSDRPVTWSIWEVCQVDTSAAYDGGVIRVGVDDATPPDVQLAIVGQPTTGSLEGDERHVPVQRVVGKLGFPNGNRLVRLDRPDGGSVEIAFDADPNGLYPDGGSRVELWLQHPIPAPLPDYGDLHPHADLVELEVLGPLTTLAPDESCELTLRWRLQGRRLTQIEAGS